MQTDAKRSKKNPLEGTREPRRHFRLCSRVLGVKTLILIQPLVRQIAIYTVNASTCTHTYSEGRKGDNFAPRSTYCRPCYFNIVCLGEYALNLTSRLANQSWRDSLLC